MKKGTLKPVSFLLLLCLLFSMITQGFLTQADTVYSYAQEYNSELTGNYVANGFSVFGGKLSFDRTAGLGKTNRAMIITDAAGALTAGKTYRISFDLVVTDSTTSDKYSILTLYSESSRSNVWDGSAKSLLNIGNINGMTGINTVTKTFVADQSYLMLSYTSLNVAQGVTEEYYTEFTIDRITVTEVVPVNVTLDACGGKFADLAGTPTTTVVNGSALDALTLPKAPVKEGYTFAGWHTDSACTVKFDGICPTTATTLYAKWVEGVYQDFENYSLQAVGAGVSVKGDTANQYVSFVPDSSETTAQHGQTAKHRVNIGRLDEYLQTGDYFTVSFRYQTVATDAKYCIKQAASNPWTAGTGYSLQKTDGSIISFNWDDTLGTATDWQTVSRTLIYNSPSNQPYLSIWLSGTSEIRLDDVQIVKLPSSSVTLKANNETTDTVLKGAVGNPLTLPSPAEHPDGKYFAGWFTDAACESRFTGSVFPETDIMLYAKWSDSIDQDFEYYKPTSDTCSKFYLYTAASSEDSNIYDGEKALYKSNADSGTGRVIINDAKMKIGSAYQMTFRIKLENVDPSPGALGIQQFATTNVWGTVDTPHYMFFQTADIESGWILKTYYFVATMPYVGFAASQNFNFYLDDIRLVEVPIVTVSFETNGGSEIAAMSGAAGSVLTVANPTPPAGKTFAGWYTDEALTQSYQVSVYPETNLKLYARYITEGHFEQDFERWPYQSNTNAMTEPFTLYTAESESDPNVYSGTHSVYYNSENGTRTYALTLFDDTMSKLQIGEKYSIRIRFKPDETTAGEYSQDGPYFRLYHTTVRSNAWSYVMDEAQGPLVNYRYRIFYVDEFSEDYYAGTMDAFTTTTQKDANGWLTMTFEFTAIHDYLALYTTGAHSLYLDDVYIQPLPSGLISENYDKPFSEDFYNLIADAGLADTLNTTDKKITKLELGVRSDYVFSAALKAGEQGNPKVYLAWDAEGNDPIDGTIFIGTGSTVKTFSSRIMTDFSGIVYLVTAGGGAGSSEMLTLFPRKYGSEENPNPGFQFVKADYDKLPTQDATALSEDGTNSAGDGLDSPETGEQNALLPCLLLLITTLSILTVLRKRGYANEK